MGFGRRGVESKGDMVARSAARALVELPAMVETVGTRRRIALMDVSRTGAKLRGAELPAVGRTVILKAGPVDALATVMWSGSNSCGISFDQPISETHVAFLNGEGAAQAGWTFQEKEAHQDWTNGLVA